MSLKQDFLATQDSNTLIKGDDWDFFFTIKDENAAVVDVTGWIIWFTLKQDTTDADPGIFQQKLTISTAESDPTNGLIKFNVPNSKTIGAPLGIAYYDIQLVNPTSSPSVVKTIKYGKLRAVEHRTVSIA